MTQKYAALFACALIASAVITATRADVTAQDRVVGRSNLSDSSLLNRDLSDDAKAKLESTHSSQQSGGHGPGRHGGLGRIFGGIFGGAMVRR